MKEKKRLKNIWILLIVAIALIMLSPTAVFADGISDAMQKVINVYPNSCSYFTSDEKIDSNSGDPRCSLVNIPSRGGLPSGRTVRDARGGDAHSCHAFAEYVWYVMFGHCITENERISASELRVGDFIIFSGPHSAIYLGEDSKNYYVYDSNWAKPADNKVRYNHTISKSRGIKKCYHATNYDTVANGNSESAGNNPYYNSYGFDCPLNNETITASTFLFQGWLDTKKQISSITCSINYGAHYVETGLYQRPDVPNATAFRVEADSNLLNIGKNDIALCANFQDGTATVVENRTVIWNPKLLWGYDSPTENMSIDDNSFQFSGWIETSRKLEKVMCSLNQGEQYITANLYQRPDVPNAIAFRADIESSRLHYGDNYVSVCAYYADGTGETLVMRKVKKCIIDALEYPQNNEIFTCKNTWFLLQGWSANDNKSIDYFEFMINEKKDTAAAHLREDLIKNARYYRVEVPLNRLKNGGNRIEVFVHYTDKTSRRIAQVNVIGESLEHKWNEGEITKESTCTDVGIKTYTCTNCKETRIEEIPAAGHQHTEIRNEKQATTDEEGYTGDVYCIDCNQLISKGTSIPKLIPTLSLADKNGILVATVSNMKYVTEYGFVYGEQADMTLETSGRTRIAYSELNADGSYSLDITELTGCTIRAYAVYTDENGKDQVVYSEPIVR